MKACDMAWAAGLFEGEGCIVYLRHGPRTSDGCYWTERQLQLTITDRDVLERFLQIVEVGVIRDSPKPKKNTGSSLGAGLFTTGQE